MQPCHSGGGDYPRISASSRLCGSATLEEGCCSWTGRMLKPTNTLSSKDIQKNIHKNASACLFVGGGGDEARPMCEMEKKERNHSGSNLRPWKKIHKKESRAVTSWWSLCNGSPASHNWNNGARCQKSRRHIMHTRATNVRRSIDRKMADWWQRWSISLGSLSRSLYGWLLFHCNTQWWKTVGPPAAYLQGWPFPELLIKEPSTVSDPQLF